MLNPTFLWHDYETFGRNPRRDRPAQFAAIRTDAELNIVGEPIELFCQPPTDMLPDPEACLLTGITPQIAQEKGLCEADFARAIHQALSAPGTCGVGYNTLRFDDEVTRFLFYRNLIDPYAREWQNDCSRWDLLDVVRTMYALRPDGMIWPTDKEGLISFKLENLSQANHLAHEKAHDALSDVYATIALAKKIRQLQPRLFDFCFALRKKAHVQEAINLLQPQPIIHISGMYPATQGCLAIVLPLMAHPNNSNEIIVYDLAHDPSELFTLSRDEISQRVFSNNAKLIELGLTRLPLKSIHINKSPIVINNVNTLRPIDRERWQIDLARSQTHADMLLAMPQLRATLAEVYSTQAPQKMDIDESLYSGFIHTNDRKILDRLRTLAPNAIGRERLSFIDPKLSELVLRYRARNWLSTLNHEETLQWESLRIARLIEGVEGYLNIDHYLAQLDTLSQERELTMQQIAILDALSLWAETIVPNNISDN